VQTRSIVRGGRAGRCFSLQEVDAAGQDGVSTGVDENFAKIFAKKNAKNFARKKS